MQTSLISSSQDALTTSPTATAYPGFPTPSDTGPILISMMSSSAQVTSRYHSASVYPSAPVLRALPTPTPSAREKEGDFSRRHTIVPQHRTEANRYQSIYTPQPALPRHHSVSLSGPSASGHHPTQVVRGARRLPSINSRRSLPPIPPAPPTDTPPLPTPGSGSRSFPSPVSAVNTDAVVAAADTPQQPPPHAYTPSSPSTASISSFTSVGSTGFSPSGANSSPRRRRSTRHYVPPPPIAPPPMPPVDAGVVIDLSENGLHSAPSVSIAKPANGVDRQQEDGYDALSTAGLQASSPATSLSTIKSSESDRTTAVNSVLEHETTPTESTDSVSPACVPSLNKGKKKCGCETPPMGSAKNSDVEGDHPAQAPNGTPLQRHMSMTPRITSSITNSPRRSQSTTAPRPNSISTTMRYPSSPFTSPHSTSPQFIVPPPPPPLLPAGSVPNQEALGKVRTLSIQAPPPPPSTLTRRNTSAPSTPNAFSSAQHLQHRQSLTRPALPSLATSSSLSYSGPIQEQYEQEDEHEQGQTSMISQPGSDARGPHIPLTSRSSPLISPFTPVSVLGRRLSVPPPPPLIASSSPIIEKTAISLFSQTESFSSDSFASFSHVDTRRNENEDYQGLGQDRDEGLTAIPESPSPPADAERLRSPLLDDRPEEFGPSSPGIEDASLPKKAVDIERRLSPQQERTVDVERPAEDQTMAVQAEEHDVASPSRSLSPPTIVAETPVAQPLLSENEAPRDVASISPSSNDDYPHTSPSTPLEQAHQWPFSQSANDGDKSHTLHVDTTPSVLPTIFHARKRSTSSPMLAHAQITPSSDGTPVHTSKLVQQIRVPRPDSVLASPPASALLHDNSSNPFSLRDASPTASTLPTSSSDNVSASISRESPFSIPDGKVQPSQLNTELSPVSSPPSSSTTPTQDSVEQTEETNEPAPRDGSLSGTSIDVEAQPIRLGHLQTSSEETGTHTRQHHDEKETRQQSPFNNHTFKNNSPTTPFPIITGSIKEYSDDDDFSRTAVTTPTASPGQADGWGFTLSSLSTACLTEKLSASLASIHSPITPTALTVLSPPINHPPVSTDLAFNDVLYPIPIVPSSSTVSATQTSAVMSLTQTGSSSPSLLPASAPSPSSPPSATPARPALGYAHSSRFANIPPPPPLAFSQSPPSNDRPLRPQTPLHSVSAGSVSAAPSQSVDPAAEFVSAARSKRESTSTWRTSSSGSSFYLGNNVAYDVQASDLDLSSSSSTTPDLDVSPSGERVVISYDDMQPRSSTRSQHGAARRSSLLSQELDVSIRVLALQVPQSVHGLLLAIKSFMEVLDAWSHLVDVPSIQTNGADGVGAEGIKRKVLLKEMEGITGPERVAKVQAGLENVLRLWGVLEVSFNGCGIDVGEIELAQQDLKGIIKTTIHNLSSSPIRPSTSNRFAVKQEENMRAIRIVLVRLFKGVLDHRSEWCALLEVLRSPARGQAS